ncbi:hypothetical protein L0636_00415 [Halomonas janggokensis]|uniref:Uncharacterized protein n=1 Tax=Vreelandella janggokensis TaxID=370767 RepID=A0ABT4IRR1_9GAMM|nr:hypothetical protein [Halomonas janggokensis]MCZ0926349.1 hypothetical protein [Halomonas janggokensis]MCZ0928887.1 hypothetical protein [Halomonas janggokensis]
MASSSVATSLSTTDENPDILGNFDLDIDDIIDLSSVLVRVDEEVTENHPKSALGTRYWHECVAVLREKLLARGWQLEDAHNQPRVALEYGNGAKLTLIACGGDVNTGTNKMPKTRNSKGSQTQAAVNSNAYQHSLELENTLPSVSASQETFEGCWFFLVYHDSSLNEIRMEISKPLEFSLGRITNWSNRIILPSVKLDNYSVNEDDFDASPDIDIPIVPKG